MNFKSLLKEIKGRIQQAQARSMLSVNAELIKLYWDIGNIIHTRQTNEGWGTGVIPRLARELTQQLPDIKGFSERNVERMLRFYREYPDPLAIPPQPVAELPSPKNKPKKKPNNETGLIPPQAVAELETNIKDSLLWLIPWGHHALIMEKIEPTSRSWYMHQTLTNGWSRNVLFSMIQSQSHKRQGKVLSNFDRLLPAPQSDLIQQTLKDPYIFDFLTLQEPFREHELELNLLSQLEKFLIELGQGFAFVGRQYHLQVDKDDYYIDLLFYHLKLRSYVVIELKKGEFKPEYVGKMNFYLNVVDNYMKQELDSSTIGLILCQDKNHIVAEYALRGICKPIGVSAYEITRALPKNLKSALPTVEQIEAELSSFANSQAPAKVAVRKKAIKVTRKSKPKPKNASKKKKSS